VTIETILIDDYIIDCAVTEGHSFKSEVTQFPVEEGADITDHVRVLPDVITLEGLVSDTPLGTLAERREITEGLPSEDALAWLKRIRTDREPVTISTSLGIYKNMVLEALEIPRDAKTGNALAFTAIFRQVVIAVNRKVTTRVAVPRSKGKSHRGTKAAREAEQKLQDQILGGQDPGVIAARDRQLDELLDSPLSNEALEAERARLGL